MKIIKVLIRYCKKKKIFQNVLYGLINFTNTKKFNSQDFIKSKNPKVFIGSKFFFDYITRYKCGDFYHFSNINIFFY